MPAIVEDPPDGRVVYGGRASQAQSNVVPVVTGRASQTQINIVPVGAGRATQLQSNVTPVASGRSVVPQSNTFAALGRSSASQSDINPVVSATVLANTPNANAVSYALVLFAHSLIMAADAVATAMAWYSVGVHPNNVRIAYDWRGSWYLAWRSDQGRIQIFRYLDDGVLDPNSPLPDVNGVGGLVADDIGFGFTLHWENVHCLEAVFSVDQELRRFRSYDSGYSWTEYIF